MCPSPIRPAVALVFLLALLLLPVSSYAQPLEHPLTPNVPLPADTHSEGKLKLSATPPRANEVCYTLPGTVHTCAWVSDATPSQYTIVTVYAEYEYLGQPVSGMKMTTNWHFQSGAQSCTITTGANGIGSCSLNIGAATPGYTVNVDVSSYVVLTTSFTPKYSICGTVTEIPRSDCVGLVELYDSTNGAGWSNNTGWTTVNTPCSWYGVWCGGGRVTQITLGSNQMTGTIPSELGSLIGLQQLVLGSNHLTGTIPSELGNLGGLQQLVLGSNQLSGSVPAQLGYLYNLQTLTLSGNQLSGSIPPELGRLGNLAHLYLNSNQITGTIPTEIGNLRNLKDLYLDSNQLHGLLPFSLTNLSGLQRFYFDADELCLPPNKAFTDWFAAIPNKFPTAYTTCRAEYLPAVIRQ